MARVLTTRRLDRFAIGLSGLCVLHCLATTALLALLASAGKLLAAAWIHEAGLLLAILIGAVALGRGLRQHGLVLPAAIGGVGLAVMMWALSLPHDGGEAMATIAGVGLVGLGHLFNQRALG